MKIKVCGMCDAGNIAEIAALNPDYTGFIFYGQSPRFAGNLDPSALNILTSNILRTGVFVNAPSAYVREQAEAYQLDLLQFHGNETPEYCAGFSNKYQIIKSFGIESENDFETVSAYETVCNYFLFDTKSKQYGGSGKKFDHDLLKNYKSKIPFFLSGGISPEDAENFSNDYPVLCKTLDINSRFEISPGIKDVEKVKNFIEKIRSKIPKIN